VLGRADAAFGAREVPDPMTTIKASCPTCGEVELTPADVSLMVCSHAPLSYYAFDCKIGCGWRGDIIIEFTGDDFQTLLFDDAGSA